MREIWSITREPLMLLSSLRSTAGLSEIRPTTMRKPELALATTTPWVVTSLGRRGVARETLFCTCTWAMSESVPVSKVRVMLALPLALEDELK